MRGTALLVIAIFVLSARALEMKCDKLSTKELLEIVKKRVDKMEQRKNEHNCEYSGTDHTRKVAFHVNLGSNIRNLKAKAVVIFDQVVLNMGKAYNPSNGLFTCPEDGVYIFTWTALTSPNSRFESDFVVNDNVVAGNRASSYNDNEYQPATKTVVVKLKKCDVAYVAAHGESAKHIYPYWSSYSGFRVF